MIKSMSKAAAAILIVGTLATVWVAFAGPYFQNRRRSKPVVYRVMYQCRAGL